MPLQIKRWAAARTRRFLCFAILFLILWPFLAWGAAHLLIVNAELERADAIIVLSGSSAYVERTRLAAQLFREERAPEIILTNDNEYGDWSNEHRRNLFFVERAREELQGAGVPAESIEVLPQAVSSTYEEAVLLRDYAAAHGLRSLLVVTSAYHSRRALLTLRRVFKESGIEVGVKAVAPGQQSPLPAVWWLRPRGWRLVAGEYLKLIYYRIKYS
jgi:uncharacterized SAM-binding protein YcdF (DUF218 family)